MPTPPSETLSQKTVLITGCSSGIGEALALECHKQGYKVIATARSISKLSGLKNEGIKCHTLDVNHTDQLKELVEVLNGQKIDFIINNAGFGTMAAMADLSPEAVEDQFQTNLFSVIKVSNAFIPQMIEQRSGCIINIGSVSGVLVTPFGGAYCASKAAVHAISDAYRMELKPFGIKVITVQPGAIASAFGDNASAVTENLIQENSAYKPIESAIRMRAQASQEHPSPVDYFAKELCKHMAKNHPPAILRIGNGSKILPLLPRLLPIKILDWVVSSRFALNKLKKS